MKTIIRTSLTDPQCRLVEVYTDRAPVRGRGVEVVGNLMDSLLTVTSPVSSSSDNLLKFLEFLKNLLKYFCSNNFLTFLYAKKSNLI